MLVALATGGLIGLERERRKSRKYAGLRTLAILCAAGPVVVYVARVAATPTIIAIYLGLAAAIALLIAYIRFVMPEANFGLTTSATVFLVALLGLLIGYGRIIESAGIAIVLAVILAEKERLHGYVAGVSDGELRDSLTLAALVFILYPIIPSTPVDPWEVVVPRGVLLFTILVLSIQFLSYVTMCRFGGSRGIVITGVLAGGANSFATAGVLGRLATQSRDAVDPAAAALLLATASMVLRNVGIALLLAVALFSALWQPALVMLGLLVGAAAIVWHRGDIAESIDVELDSPLSIPAAVKFSIAYVGILLSAVLAESMFGHVGLYATAFAGGLVSSAAVAVTAATVFADGTVGLDEAAGMVVIGITASFATKIVLVEVLGARMRRQAIIPMAVIGFLGLLVFVLT